MEDVYSTSMAARRHTLPRIAPSASTNKSAPRSAVLSLPSAIHLPQIFSPTISRKDSASPSSVVCHSDAAGTAVSAAPRKGGALESIFSPRVATIHTEPAEASPKRPDFRGSSPVPAVEVDDIDFFRPRPKMQFFCDFRQPQNQI